MYKMHKSYQLRIHDQHKNKERKRLTRYLRQRGIPLEQQESMRKFIIRLPLSQRAIDLRNQCPICVSKREGRTPRPHPALPAPKLPALHFWDDQDSRPQERVPRRAALLPTPPSGLEEGHQRKSRLFDCLVRGGQNPQQTTAKIQACLTRGEQSLPPPTDTVLHSVARNEQNTSGQTFNRIDDASNQPADSRLDENFGRRGPILEADLERGRTSRLFDLLHRDEDSSQRSASNLFGPLGSNFEQRDGSWENNNPQPPQPPRDLDQGLENNPRTYSRHDINHWQNNPHSPSRDLDTYNRGWPNNPQQQKLHRQRQQQYSRAERYSQNRQSYQQTSSSPFERRDRRPSGACAEFTRKKDPTYRNFAGQQLDFETFGSISRRAPFQSPRKRFQISTGGNRRERDKDYYQNKRQRRDPETMSEGSQQSIALKKHQETSPLLRGLATGAFKPPAKDPPPSSMLVENPFPDLAKEEQFQGKKARNRNHRMRHRRVKILKRQGLFMPSGERLPNVKEEKSSEEEADLDNPPFGNEELQYPEETISVDSSEEEDDEEQVDQGSLPHIGAELELERIARERAISARDEESISIDSSEDDDEEMMMDPSTQARSSEFWSNSAQLEALSDDSWPPAESQDTPTEETGTRSFLDIILECERELESSRSRNPSPKSPSEEFASTNRNNNIRGEADVIPNSDGAQLSGSRQSCRPEDDTPKHPSVSSAPVEQKQSPSGRGSFFDIIKHCASKPSAWRTTEGYVDPLPRGARSTMTTSERGEGTSKRKEMSKESGNPKKDDYEGRDAFPN